ncbi:hypothetical protein ACSQ67_018009 [Phaseolus vulgaris]
MAWLLKERRGPAWKQGWTTNTLCSLSAPPLQLLTIVAIVIHPHLPRLPLAAALFLIFVAYTISKHGSRLVLPAPPPFLGGIRLRTEGGGFPWGVAALVVLLMVLASFLSNFRSMWSPLIWTPY